MAFAVCVFLYVSITDRETGVIHNSYTIYILQLAFVYLCHVAPSFAISKLHAAFISERPELIVAFKKIFRTSNSTLRSRDR